MMFSVGDVEDIRWLVHVTSFEEEWSEGRENKGSGYGWYIRVHTFKFTRVGARGVAA